MDSHDAMRHNFCLEEILENTEDAFFSVNNQWCITFVNKQAERYFQKSRNDLSGTDLRRLLPENSMDRQKLREAMDNRVLVRWEALMPGGFRMDATAYPISDGGIAIQLNDKKAEDQYQSLFDLKLKQSEERQAYLLNLSDALREIEDPVEIQSIACRLIKEKLCAEQSSYTDCYTDKGYIVIRIEDAQTTGPQLKGTYREEDFPVGFGILRSGKYLVIEDILNTQILPKKEAEKWFSLRIRAQISVPLVKHGNLVATFSVRHSTPRAWTEPEILLVQETAERTWAAVERARAQRELRIREEQIADALEFNQAILKTSPLGIIVIDSNGMCTFVNQSGTDIGGGTIEQMMQLDYFSLELWKQSGLLDASRRVLETGISETICRQFVNTLGKKAWYDCRLSRFMSGGQPHVLVVCNDTTEENEALTALRESEKHFRTIIETAGEGIVIATPEGFYIYVNQKMADMLGYPAEEILGKTSVDFSPENGRQQVLQIRKGLQKGDIQSGELQFRRKDGSELWTMYNATPLYNDEGAHIANFAMYTDITEHKQVDQALHESEQRALALVAELERADKSKNEFINILSHELRNPLAAIDAWLQLAEMTGSTIDMLNAQGIIRRQVDQLARLTEDLLEISRVMNNKIVLRKENVNLSQVAMKVVDDYLAQFDNKGIRLEYASLDDTVPIHADPGRIAQIIGNLLHNALKFTKEGGRVQVLVSTDGDCAEIAVIDNGIGIHSEALSILFEPFMQWNQSIDRKSGGLGIGLSIVKGICELHGGSVQARSEGPGKGSAFMIRLPLMPKEEERKQEQLITRSTRSFRILMIEDNRDLVEAVNALLTLKGHRVQTATDGLQGLKRAAEFSPEIVICDIGLPGMSGFEVIQKIRREFSDKPVFLIALSGYGSTQDIGLAEKSGCNLYLIKPVNMQTLLDALEKAERELPALERTERELPD